jgi:N-acetylmuramoyl-L-alanine amidase
MNLVLDAGHGGNDPGGKSLGRAEKETVLIAQDYVWKFLAERGHTCTPTRVKDAFVPLSVRAAFANQHEADCFVSLHCNASGNPAAKGPWTIHARGSTRGKALAHAIQTPLAAAAYGSKAAVYPDESNWVGGRRLAVLRQTRMPAVIVEMGFMTNPKESELLDSDAYLEHLARAIAAGVHEWAGT